MPRQTCSKRCLPTGRRSKSIMPANSPTSGWLMPQNAFLAQKPLFVKIDKDKFGRSPILQLPYVIHINIGRGGEGHAKNVWEFGLGRACSPHRKRKNP